MDDDNVPGRVWVNALGFDLLEIVVKAPGYAMLRLTRGRSTEWDDIDTWMWGITLWVVVFLGLYATSWAIGALA